MANIDHTILTSDNAERFDEITKNLSFENEDSVQREPGELYIRTRWGVPHRDIKALSEKYPDITLKAVFSFEYDRHSEIQHVQYIGGKDEVIDLERGYMRPVMEELEKTVPCYDELLNKAIEIFERVDVLVDDPEKGKSIDWCDAEVTVVVEHDGYKMSVKKYSSSIEEIQCFKAREIKSVEWSEIKESDVDTNSIPF